MFWDWQFTWEILPLLAQASIITVEATILGFLIAAVFGLFFAIGRLYGPKWLSIPLTGVIEFIRSTPLLIQIVWFYYALPVVLGVDIPAHVAAVMVLSLYTGAFYAEIIRGGVNSIERGWMNQALLEDGEIPPLNEVYSPL